MAFGTPYLIGTTGTASSAASQPVSVGTGTSAGDCIIVACGNSSAAGATISGVADSAGNVYVAADAASSSNEFGQIWISYYGSGGAGTPTGALTTSNTITVTYSGTSGIKNVVAAGVSGVATSNAVDQAPTPGHGTSAAPTVTSGTLAQAAELAIGVICNASAGGVPSGLGSFTPVESYQNGSSPEVTVAYLDTASTAAVTFSGTITSANWACLLITLAGLPASAQAAPAYSPQAPGWQPGLPGVPGAPPFTPWPPWQQQALLPVTGSGGTVLPKPVLSGSGTQGLPVIPPYVPLAPGWTPGSPPGAPGGTPFLPWPPPQQAPFTPVTGAGGVILPKPALAGTAAETFTGTGSAAVPVPVLGAAGTIVNPPVTWQPPDTSPGWYPGAPAAPLGTPFAPWPPPAPPGIAAIPAVTGTGSAAVPKPQPAGNGTLSFTGTGSESLPKPSLAGAGEEWAPTVAVSQPVQPLPPQWLPGLPGGHGQVPFTAWPPPQQAPFAPVTGGGGVTLPRPALAGAGTETFTGTGSERLPKPGPRGTAAQAFAGSGSAALRKPAAAGAGRVPFAGAGSAASPKPRLAGQGTAVLPPAVPAIFTAGTARTTWAAAPAQASRWAAGKARTAWSAGAAGVQWIAGKGRTGWGDG